MSGLCVRASAKDGVAVISVLNGNTMLSFLGASCTASVLSGTKDLNSVTLSPNRGENAVVAMVTTCVYSKQPAMVAGGLVGLRWEGEKLVVDTDTNFISPVDRLGQVVPYGEQLIVTTKGQQFICSRSWQEGSAKYLGSDPGQYLKESVRMANNANLLCRYLVGQATFEELEAVASGDMRTAEQIRIAELEKSLCMEKEKALVAADNLADHLGEIDILSEDLKKAREAVVSLEEESTSLNVGLEKTLHDKKVAEARYADAWERVKLLENQLNQTLGAKWRRFWKGDQIRWPSRA